MVPLPRMLFLLLLLRELLLILHLYKSMAISLEETCWATHFPTISIHNTAPLKNTRLTLSDCFLFTPQECNPHGGMAFSFTSTHQTADPMLGAQ